MTRRFNRRDGRMRRAIQPEQLEPRRLFAAGVLDASFNGTGIVTASYRNTNDGIDVAQQADGKVVVAGDTQTTGQSKDVVVARFTSAGGVDAGFGTGGRAIISLSSSDDVATGVGVQTDGRIVVVGTTGSGQNLDMFMVRLSSTGAFDNTFSGDGRFVSAPGIFGVEGATAIARQGDGKYALAGVKATVGLAGITATQFMVARVTSGGSLDTTFSGDGRAFASFGRGFEVAAGVSVDVTTGRIVAGGASANGALEFGVAIPGFGNLPKATQSDMAAARFTSTGGPDNTFSGDGKQTVNFTGKLAAATDAFVQGDARVVLGGAIQSANGPGDFAAARLTAGGSLDGTFATGGRFMHSLGVSEGAFGMTLQKNGRILLVGHRKTNATTSALAILRLLNDLVYLDPASLTVNIDGTTGNDTVTISRNTTTNVITVTINASSKTFAGALVKAFAASLGNGNDAMTMSSAVMQPARFRGGAGNDVFQGGGGNDDALGDAGNDILHGNNGNDRLEGGAGVDQLFGEAGNDSFAAQDGTVDAINGGTGTDAIINKDAGDTVVSVP